VQKHSVEGRVGSVQTPQILELSGVGNKTLLERLGISVVLDLPQVRSSSTTLIERFVNLT
jgi:hypothetical protein